MSFKCLCHFRHLPLYYKIENPTVLKKFLIYLLRHFSPRSPALATTDIFNIAMVLAFPKHYTIGVLQYVVFLLAFSPRNIHF